MEQQQARRRFTREFKLESVRQVISEGRTQRQVAADLGAGTSSQVSKPTPPYVQRRPTSRAKAGPL